MAGRKRGDQAGNDCLDKYLSQNPILIDARSAFVSDVHLSELDPSTAQRFVTSIAACKGLISGLFILGDLFDAWVGDDSVDSPAMGALARSVFALFESLECPIYFCAGNRDFLIGVGSNGIRHRQAHGMQLLDEQTIATFASANGKTFQLMLCHGDEFCLDDKDYQEKRPMLRGPAWQKAFLSGSLQERQIQAALIRAQSKQAKEKKSIEIMDVSTAAIERTFSASKISLLIHGHTHRPQQHEYQNPNATRVVLSDWDGKAQRGAVYFLSRDIIDRYAAAG